MLNMSKKSLKPKKKNAKKQDSINMANPSACHNDYIISGLHNNFNTYLYACCTRRELLGEPRPQHTDNGALIVHLDSVLTHQSFRKQLKNSTRPYKWQTYYETLMQEPLRMEYFWIMQAAKDQGLVIKALSTTPEQYKKTVEAFLHRHKIKDMFHSIKYPEKPWRSESQWLRHMFMTEQNSFYPAYILFDRQQYPKIKLRCPSLIY